MTVNQSDSGFKIVVTGSMVPAFEVLRSIERYHTLVGVGDHKHRLVSSEMAERRFYYKCIQQRKKYLISDAESQLPAHVRHLHEKLIDRLRSSDWNLLSIDLCFLESRNAILRELLSFGLIPAAWYYVVDHLPTKVPQLHGALLVIMPEKLKSELKDVSIPGMFARIIELVLRLRLLMHLSEAPQKERENYLKDIELSDECITEECYENVRQPAILAMLADSTGLPGNLLTDPDYPKVEVEKTNVEGSVPVSDLDRPTLTKFTSDNAASSSSRSAAASVVEDVVASSNDIGSVNASKELSIDEKPTKVSVKKKRAPEKPKVQIVQPERRSSRLITK